MQLNTTSKTTVDLNFKETETDEYQHKTDNCKMNQLQVFSYLTIKHWISQQSYHELSMQFPELPCSHKAPT